MMRVLRDDTQTEKTSPICEIIVKSYKQPKQTTVAVPGVEEAAQPDEVAEPSLASQNEDIVINRCSLIVVH